MENGEKSAGKKPYISNWQKEATSNKEKITEWWTKWPAANIGIATGRKSQGLVVIDLDIDDNKGINGYETLKEWQNEHGELPETWQSITGRGGYHLFILILNRIKTEWDYMRAWIFEAKVVILSHRRAYTQTAIGTNGSNGEKMALMLPG